MAAAAELLQLTNRAKRNKGEWIDDDDDDDNSNSASEEAVDHDNLLKKIKSLGKKDSKRRKGPLRSELKQNISEFHLKSEGDNGHVNLDDLVGSLQASSYNSKLKKSLESLQRMGRTVEVPLAKPVAERIQRKVAYEETSRDISKWDAMVQKNRRAEQLSFPLDPYKPVEMSTSTLTTTFKPQTPLEQEIASVLQSSSKILEREDKELSLEEEEALKNMSLEEALERRHELQKLRALQSYYEQKCRRMKKIKSKKYHRIKRRAEKRAMSKQTFEQLQKENPELAEAELEKAEKLRIAERMTLKHRNTSKWAKNIIRKGINDVQDRQALAEQLRISRQLTETKTGESDGDEGNESEEKMEIPDNVRNIGLVGDSSENPWLLNDEKRQEDVNGEFEEHEKTQERLRKLKPVTAEETEQDNEDGQQDEQEDSKDLDHEETFELMDETAVQGNGKKLKKKIKRTQSGIEKTKKRKKEKIKNNKAEEKKGKVKGKKKNVKKDTQGITDEETEVKKKREQKKKTIKRRITEEKGVKEKQKKKRKRAELVNSVVEEDIEEGSEADRKIGNAEDHEQFLIEGDEMDDLKSSVKNLLNSKTSDPNVTETNTKNSFNLNPKNVFQIEDLGRQNDLLNFTGDGSDDDIDPQRMTIQEAFANDDVIEEFINEKADAAEASEPKDLDLSLPGWGDWGGPGIDETKRKKKFLVQAKPAPPRKDSKLAHVIINEQRDKKFAKNQVSQLPFPFTSHDQWECSVRVPLGKDWNTTSVHQKLVKPRIVTLPGTIIEPIKPSKGVEDSGSPCHAGKIGVKTMGSGVEIHN